MSVKEELQTLKERVARLEIEIQRLSGEHALAETPAIYVVPGHRVKEPLSNQDLLQWMLVERIIREPTKEELALAAEWDLMPIEDKNVILWELDHLPPGPMASDIIAENRGE